MKLTACIFQLIAVLVLSFPVQAQTVWHRRAAFRSVASGLTIEDFEGTGAPTGWTTTSGNPNWDYTTSPINGSQSLFVPDTTSSNDGFQYAWPENGVDEIFIGFKFKCSALPASGNLDLIIFRTDDGVTELGRIGPDIGGNWEVSDDNGSTWPASAGTISTGTTYYIKCQYTKGTGSNAIIRTWFSTGTSWGTAVEITDAPATAQTGMIRSFNGDTKNTTYHIDQFWYGTTDELSVPEDLDP